MALAVLVRQRHLRRVLGRPGRWGEEVTFDFELPPLPPGRYVVELDLVAEKVAWFAQVGSHATKLDLM